MERNFAEGCFVCLEDIQFQYFSFFNISINITPGHAFFRTILEPVMDYTNFEEVLREFVRSVKMVFKCDRIYN